MPGDSMVYLASPYSHPDPAVREQRFQAVCRAVAALLRAGHVVFSPIVHCHALVPHGLPTDWAFWQRVDREHLERCDEVVVLMLDGWEVSEGVQAEIGVARALGKPVRYLAADEAFVAPTLAHVGSGTAR
jgi:nucleoside 2-deoxyribosyltransferase